MRRPSSSRSRPVPVIGVPVGFCVQGPQISQAAQSHQRTYLEASGQTGCLVRERRIGIELFSNDRQRRQHLGRHSVARTLDVVFGDRSAVAVGKRGLAEPDVREFVGESEHLRCPRIGSVQEHERREVVHQCEAPELLDVESALGIASDDAAHHDKHPGVVRLLYEAPQGVRPCGEIPSFVEVEGECCANLGGDGFHTV